MASSKKTTKKATKKSPKTQTHFFGFSVDNNGIVDYDWATDPDELRLNDLEYYFEISWPVKDVKLTDLKFLGKVNLG